MFDLEKAITAWRRRLRYSRVFLDDDLDELEAHLRDHVDRLAAEGLSLEDAFHAAERRLGTRPVLEAAYRNVRWGRRKRRRQLGHTLTTEAAMLKNYLTIALRNLRRHTGYAFINITGLAVGLAACLVIGLFIQHKFSFDRHFDQADRIFRLVHADTAQSQLFGALPGGFAPALKEMFPEIEETALVLSPREAVLRVDNRPVRVEQVVEASPTFFEVFSFPFVQGNPATALEGPNQIVLTRSLAQRLFGREEVVDRSLTYEGDTYLVTALIEDVPANTHFQFDAAISFSERSRRNWLGSEINWRSFHPSLYTYLRLTDQADPEALQASLRTWLAATQPEEAMLLRNAVLTLEPLPRIHLHSSVAWDIAPQSDMRYLYLFGAIGLLILLIACINYMNLSTARSVRRAREVGLRKVVGAGRGQLIRQFLGESILLSLGALLLALGITALALPWMSRLSGSVLNLTLNGTALLALLGIVVLVGVAAGSYPAFLLSAFRPTQVLTGRSPMLRAGGATLRKVLVVFQFTVSLVLIIATLVVKTQMDYVHTKRLGFDTEQVVVLNDTRSVDARREAFRAELLASPRVAAVSLYPPPDAFTTARRQFAHPITGDAVAINEAAVDYDYAETLGFQLVAGRFFSPAFADSSAAVVLNETAARLLDLGDEPVGKTFPYGRGTVTVIGVVEDFHTTSLHEPIEPFMMKLAAAPPYNTLVRLQPGATDEALAHLKQVYGRFIPDRPFDFMFLDARLTALYKSEQRVGRIFGLFAALAILIAALGLFGLAAFTAEQRTREIGIRKVLGASVSSIVVLLSKELVALVLAALLVAAPVAYFAMREWLANFAYHVELSWVLFAVAGLAAVGVAFFSVSYQSVQAALSNPVQALRHE